MLPRLLLVSGFFLSLLCGRFALYFYHESSLSPCFRDSPSFAQPSTFGSMDSVSVSDTLRWLQVLLLLFSVYFFSVALHSLSTLASFSWVASSTSSAFSLLTPSFTSSGFFLGAFPLPSSFGGHGYLYTLVWLVHLVVSVDFSSPWFPSSSDSY